MKKMLFGLLFVVGCLHAQDLPQNSITIPVLDRDKFDPNPFVQLQKTIDAAKVAGSPYGFPGVLATTNKECNPSTRLSHIGSITNDGIVFYTNKETKKWQHLSENPKISYAIYSPTNSSSVVLNGSVDMNYDPQGKDVDVTINGKRIAFKRIGILFKPTEFIFREFSSQDAYNIEQSYVYTKGPDGKWTLSNEVKYYVSPKS